MPRKAGTNKQSNEMMSIGSLMARYRERLRPPQASVEKEVVVVIKEVTGYDITVAQVEYTVYSRTVALRVPSILKTELLTHKTAILDNLSKRLGTHHAPEVLL